MRSRTIREGSVGLLILLGLAMFGGLVMWLRGVSVGKRSYKIVAEFANGGGMQAGAVVRYRGVDVGKITTIVPSANGVDVGIEIASTELLIPRDVIVEANQQGLIGAPYIDIRPQNPLPPGVAIAKPLDPQCNPNLIVCNNGRVQGQVGVSFDELVRSTVRVVNLYSDPTFYANINALAKNGAEAAANVSQLTRDLSGLSRSVQQNVASISVAANSVTEAATQTSNQVGVAADQISKTANRFGVAADQLSTTANRFGSAGDQISNTARRFGQTSNQINLAANKFGQTATQISNTAAGFGAIGNEVSLTARQYRLSAQQLNQLLTSVNGLVVENRSSLVGTLRSLSETSDVLRSTVTSLTPALNRVNSGQLLRNLETLSANASQASANLRDLSTALSDRSTVVSLQATLDSARATFENAQKITSDLDELTGDPAFRDNLKSLVNGLGKLVSSTQQLEQDVYTASALEPARNVIITQFPTNPTNIKLLKPVEANKKAPPASESLPLLSETQKQSIPSPQPFQAPTDEKLPQPFQAPTDEKLSEAGEQSLSEESTAVNEKPASQESTQPKEDSESNK